MIYICAWCKKELSRDDAPPGDSSPSNTSHGICPSCALKVYGNAAAAPQRCGAVHPEHPDLVCRMSRDHEIDHWCRGLSWPREDDN